MALDAARLVRRAAEFRVLAAFVNGGQGMEAVFRNLLPVGTKMAAGIELLDFLGVAACAHGWRDEHGNLRIRSRVLGAHRRVGSDLVTVDAGNAHLGVPAVFPVRHHGGHVHFMAIDACLRLVAERFGHYRAGKNKG